MYHENSKLRIEGSNPIPSLEIHRNIIEMINENVD